MMSNIPVLVTTARRGVFFGYLDEMPDTIPETITLKNCRMCLRWGSDTKGVFGLAVVGPVTGSHYGQARVGPATEVQMLESVTSLTPCAAEAVAAWEAGPWE